MSNLALVFALIGAAGIGAQWLAWRTGLPGIALMLLAGILVGPVFHLIHPKDDFGPLLEPTISIAVALILFEGGLKLKFRELRRTHGAMKRLVLIGAPVAWVLITLVCYYIGGLVWPVAILFGGILVVTGPTVVLPMLRQITLHPRPRAILKWEAIVNDPVGVLLAVATYEYLRRADEGVSIAQAALGVAGAGLVAGIAGLGVAMAIGWLFPRGKVPEYLKAPVLLVAVISAFVLSNLIEHETGLLAVTVMGIALANMRIPGFHDIEPFKENVSVLAIGTVFILLSASLDTAVLRQLEWRFIGLILALIFIARPLTILISLAFSRVPWPDRIFVAAIAPRGVVAVAISGVFALRLENLGYEDGSVLVALSFAIAAGTILVYGFAAPFLSRRLGLAGTKREVLVVGANDWSIAFVRQLQTLDIPARLVDTNWHRLKAARQAGIPTLHGEILAEATEDYVDFDRVQALAATSDNEAYNTLVCNHFGPTLGRDSVYQLGAGVVDHDNDRHALPSTLRGLSLFDSGMRMGELSARHAAGWTFRQTRVSDKFNFRALERSLPAGADLLLLVRPSGIVRFFTHASRPRASAGDIVVSYGPPDLGKSGKPTGQTKPPGKETAAEHTRKLP